MEKVSTKVIHDEPDINNIFDYTGKIWRRNPNIK